MGKYIFTLKEDQLNIALIRNRGRKLEVVDSTRIEDETVSKMVESYAMVAMPQLSGPIGEFVKKTEKRVRACEFVIGLDSIISRTIEIPHLNKKDLLSYMDNNMTSFFTVDMEDYFFDYKIVSEIPKDKDNPKRLQIKVVVVPRAVIIGIDKLVKDLGLKLNEVSIYPDVMQRLVQKDEALGVLDIGVSRSIFTIYAEGTTFIYSAINTKGDAFEDFADEVEYFTDFYASRHEGEPLAKLYVIGGEDHSGLISYMDERLSSEVHAIDYTPFRTRASASDFAKYPVIILSQFKIKEIRGEAIDFSEEEAIRQKVKRRFEPAHLFLLLALVTAGWFAAYGDHLNDQIALYERGETKDSEIIELQERVRKLKEEAFDLEAYDQAASDIENRYFDYRAYFEEVKKTLPSNVNISHMEVTKQSIQMSLVNVEGTVDLLEVLIAFNESGYFEKVEIADIALNDVIDGYDLTLMVVQKEASDE